MIPRYKFYLLLSLCPINILGVLFQMKYPQYMVEILSTTFPLIFISLAVQKPEEIIDMNSGSLNMQAFKEEIRRNSKAPFVRNFRENYEGGELPIYALVEVFSFGTLSKFYKNMKSADKKAVAKSFDIGYTYLESWLESIAYVRNICAHYGRLYNAKFSKTPVLYKEYTQAGIGNNRMFGVLLCMKQILKNDNHWNTYVDQIEALINKYKHVDVKTMGFSENWKELLLRK
jgi:abortive infection bacteriophage resistance protein